VLTSAQLKLDIVPQAACDLQHQSAARWPRPTVVEPELDRLTDRQRSAASQIVEYRDPRVVLIATLVGVGTILQL